MSTFKNKNSLRTIEAEISQKINPIPPGLFEGGAASGGGGGSGGGRGRKVPAAYNSKTINDNEMKFDGVVKDR